MIILYLMYETMPLKIAITYENVKTKYKPNFSYLKEYLHEAKLNCVVLSFKQFRSLI